ncbi:hypothetical protein [Streptomyces sp. SID12488]|uniref:hypothetical protein n=1 Tax=Streptomyces sp. SID12488 TaxID=2706040 RepID=UPI0013DB193E|nr:hypothetical protein [Streptomyces sp. SID12488]NEA69018.1 hypothetical protein [Streptomyces sp. SID12488]
MTAEWYILLEEDTRETRRAEGVELRLHRWTLVATQHIDGDEAQAAAAAEKLALRHAPAVLARHARPGDTPARHAFLTQDGGWVVLVKQRHRECHIRVTTARLIHTQEEKEAPPKSFKEKLRSALEDPQPPEPASRPWKPGGET